VRLLPRIAAAAGLLVFATLPGPNWCRARAGGGGDGPRGADPRAAGLPAHVALVAPERSAISRFFCGRVMMFLGTYSYGLYVYHHLISYYLTSNRTELVLAGWLGSHGLAVAVQATLGMSASLLLAYLSYEFLEKRFLALKGRFEMAADKAAYRRATVGAGP
jgi:peptidoglycan/LPS O-acetylase OafA/YrhL